MNAATRRLRWRCSPRFRPARWSRRRSQPTAGRGAARRAGSGAWKAAGAAAGAVAGCWLATFGDPRLDALVTEAIAHNLDLQGGGGPRQVAAEYAKLADSTLWPQVNLLARGGGEMGGDASGLQGVGLFADWELDLWGRVRSAAAASDGELRIGRGRCRVRAAVDGGTGGEVLFPRDRSEPAVAARRGHGRGLAGTGLASPSSDSASARATAMTRRSRAPTSKRSATPSSSSGCRASRPCAPRSAASAAIPAAEVEVPRNSRSRRAGAGRAAVRTARAAPGRHRRRTARGGGVLRGPGGQGGAAAHASSSRVRSTTSRATCSCCKTRTIRSGAPARACCCRYSTPVRCNRRSASARKSRSWRWPSTAASARAHSARSKARCRPSSPRAGARPYSAARWPRTRRRSTSANVRYKVGSGDLRGVRQQQTRGVWIEVRAAARADRKARATRQPVPRPGGGFDAAPAPVAQAKE